MSKSEKIDFEGLFPKPDAQFRSAEFKSLSHTLEIAISLRKDAIYQVGFETNGNAAFKLIISKMCGLFVGKTKEEAEHLSLEECFTSLSLAPSEYESAEYVWTVLQDTISKLPSPDPFDRAVKKIARLNSEFPHSAGSNEFED